MDSPTIRIKPCSEKKRERNVLRYAAAYRDIPHLESLGSIPETCCLPADHNAQPSADRTLTALAQSAALRLGAQRALISLIDDQRQYVLAEATPRLPLRTAHFDDLSNPLWLGSISIPRTWGVCEQLLRIDPGKIAAGKATTVIVCRDLAESDQFAQRSYIKEGPKLRFHAGAALVSPDGAIIGAISVFDDKPRPEGLPWEDETYLVDLSTTLVEYLATYPIKDRYRRGEKFTRGLISFAEGASALIPLNENDPLDVDEPPSPTLTDTTSSEQDSRSTRSIHDLLESSKVPPLASPQNASGQQTLQLPQQNHQQPSIGSDTVRAGSSRKTSLRALQDSILPANSRSMFARAANVMLASSGLDGVLILDASIAATGHRQLPAAPERRHTAEDLTESDSEAIRSKSESSEESSSHDSTNNGASLSSTKRCQVLGAAPSSRAMVKDDGTPGLGSLSESNLARLLRECPHGKVFNYTAKGDSISSTDDSSSNKSTQDKAFLAREDTSSISKPKRSRTSKSSKVINELLAGAKSVAFIPFWDYERSRWFAGCLCWTNSPDRMLSTSVDLAYFNIFSHSIMRELSRLDAVALNQQKTTFVASISHELRSPLHGILGALEFIKDTNLDTFQTSMLNSLNACGQTLLDTIDHVLDHSRISESATNLSSRRLKNTNTMLLSSKPLRTRRSRDPAFDIGLATEEVIEAVFAGASYIPIASSKASPAFLTKSSSGSTSTLSTNPTVQRKTIYIVLDIAPEQDWIYCYPVGSWKRTVMNIFGNAIKYTANGYITVSLQATDVVKNSNPATMITLTITDTGAGMGPAFLANKAFQPFSQENPHSSGVGLGLSIVRQIIETNGGKLEISSDHKSGTKLTIKLYLVRPNSSRAALPQRLEYLSWLPRFKDRSICILCRSEEDKPDSRSDEPQNAEGLARFTRALTATLTDHLKMQVVHTTNRNGNDADIVICPEPNFEYLASARHQRAEQRAQRASVTIFCALDALEAATLRSDVRIKNKDSDIEIMDQPLGPYKLAYVLNKCLDRLEHPIENVQLVESPPNPSSDPPPQSTQEPSEPSAPTPPLPPLCNQPYWSETDLHQDSSSQASSQHAVLPAVTPMPEGGNLPIRPKLATASRLITEQTHVLITDDNAINRTLLVAFMGKHNLQYAEAENGLEALRTYQEASVHYNIILMDVSMPVMDGMSATRAIRHYEQEQNVPRSCIIALTGLASASARLEALNSGVDHFMTKPVNFKALNELIKTEKKRRKEAAGER